jgi:hypothetical protein
MEKLVSVRAFDGTIVRIPESKLEIFTVQQNKLKRLLNEGKSVDEIKSLIKEGAL